jgi:mono/diheme cytochrome c family protein
MKKLFISALVISSALVACKGSKETASTTPAVPLDCTSKVVSYTSDIKAIMEANCTRCHNTNNKAGYNFLSLESVKKAAQSGHLLGTIKHQKGFKGMPYFAAKLDQASIDKIECWINNGMAE